RPAVAALTGLVVLVTLLGLGGISWKWRDAVAAGQAARAAEGDALAKAAAEARAEKQAQDARAPEEAAKTAAPNSPRQEAEGRRRAEAERDAKQKALVRVEGLRLAAESSAARHGDPGLALLLALEGVQRFPHRLTFAVLHDALRDCREVRTLAGPGAPVRYT